MILKNILNNYKIGIEDSILAENIFWFGHKLTPDNKEYLYIERYEWDKKRKEIQEIKKGFGILEKIAFEIGTTLGDLSIPIETYPPLEPIILK